MTEKTLNFDVALENLDSKTIKLITMKIWRAYYQVRRIKRKRKKK